MKKVLLYTSVLAFLLVGCYKSYPVPIKGWYKARFEIAGICSNYTFTLTKGNLAPSLIEKEWTNPQTGITYKNAFGVTNPCQLPANLKQGDEFYFVLMKPEEAQHCMVCEVYYPTPQKKLAIRVVSIEP